MNRLVCGDSADLMADLPDGSVDVIFTDPPYAAEFLPCYQTLADHAPRLLKPSGFLATYAGHAHLDRVMAILGGSGLSWYWMLAQVQNSSACAMLGRNVCSLWKPILIYQKAPFAKVRPQVLDLVGGKWATKRHPWEQSLAVSVRVLDSLAGPGAVVLDPFMGTGTNLLAARLLDKGVEYIGFELDPATFAMAVSKLEQQPISSRAIAEVST